MVKLAAPLRSLLIVGAAAGIVAGASHADVTADWGRSSDQVAAADRSSAALQAVQVCAGPDRPGTPGFDANLTQRVSLSTAVAPEKLVQGGSDTGSLRIDSAPTGITPSITATRSAPDPVTIDKPVSAVLTGTGRSALGVTATQFAIDTDKTVAGLAMQACQSPVNDAWVPLGGNQVGRLDRVVLTNPSSSAITVDAVVVGRQGPVAGKGGSDVVVGPHDRRVISIGDFDTDLTDAMLHVTSIGGPVAVTVADVLMVGERRAGESLAGPIAPPSKDQTIPAFAVVAGAPDVRVAVPGRDDATVRVQAIDASGNVVADEVRDLTAGTSSAVPLTGAGRGTYSVRVTADAPVVAAGLAVTGSTGTTDLAWASASDPITALGGLALPTLPSDLSAELVIAPNDRAQRVEVVTGATTQTITVPADRPVKLDVTDSSAIWITPRSGGPTHAGVVVSGRSKDGDLLEILPVEPVVNAATVRDVTAGVD
ncbi:DUF5719 family protein [Calidifontibacter terrae]